MDRAKLILAKRYAFLCVGLLIMAFGVAFSIKAGLGTSPISSVPYVVNCFTPLTVGTATIGMHCVFILLQIALLRRNYQPVQLMQLPVAFLFGYVTDFAIYILRSLACGSYLHQWLCCAVGIVLVAVGVSFEVTANVVTLAGEGLVLAVCKVAPIPFGTMKVLFDVSLVCIAIALSLVFVGGLTGVREGTVAAALFVGMLARQFNGPLGKAAARLFGGGS